MMSTWDSQPASIVVGTKASRKYIGRSIESVALIVFDQTIAECSDGLRVHWFGKKHKQVETTFAVGIHQQRVKPHLSKLSPPGLGRYKVAFFRNRQIVIVMQVDINREPA